MQQIAAALQASPLLHGQVSSLLLQPIVVRVWRESYQAHSASLQVNEEKHIVGQQPFERQDFRREEVHPDQHVPVLADRVFPRNGLIALRSRRKSMATKIV